MLCMSGMSVLGCLRGSGWLLSRSAASFCGRGPVARVAARLTTLYLISRDTSSVTERVRPPVVIDPLPALRRRGLAGHETRLQVEARGTRERRSVFMRTMHIAARGRQT